MGLSSNGDLPHPKPGGPREKVDRFVVSPVAALIFGWLGWDVGKDTLPIFVTQEYMEFAFAAVMWMLCAMSIKNIFRPSR